MQPFQDDSRPDEHRQPTVANPTLTRYLTITAPRRHTRQDRNRDTPRVIDNEGLELDEMNDFA